MDDDDGGFEKNVMVLVGRRRRETKKYMYLFEKYDRSGERGLKET